MHLTGQIPKVAEENIVQIWLDSYDDMFSDFDPRPYSKRMWSDDFIIQIRKVIKDHPKKISVLRILLPGKEKQEMVEKDLIKRLSNFFEARRNEVLRSRKETIYKGILYIFLGILVMLTTEYLTYINKDKFSWHLLLRVFEPLGWFLLWMGLDIIVDSRKSIHDISFFSKLAAARIEFAVY
ncbi:hypothetical protein C7S20_10035 [Christiangramia fulva]|uniref:SMODS and SLOG-associating 2TM effector domain-containing protein n=1 Tax=Christiangramia fulva TaxID=2126553 RepID=A0A2R3Z5M0_9FLAO|nr:hypothetical protein [Christiangramia fulva]AVR45576.1 hypothetical protein C7S20_10035 [Christiangramia fulva]